MRNIALILSALILIPCAYAVEYGALTRGAKSFLTPQKFPTVFNDVDFTTRMQVLAQGYDDVGTEYDENGVCVSGCAFKGMTIEDEERMMQRASEELQRLLAIENARRGAVAQPAQPSQPAQPAQPSQPAQPAQPSQPAQPAQPSQPVQPAQPSQPSQPAQPAQPSQPAQPAQPSQPAQPAQPSQSTFFRPPVGGNVKVGSDFGERRPPKTRNGSGSRYHRGLDIKASTGTPLYAAADGVVVRANYSKSYGNVIEIEHSLGGSAKKVKTVYAHMSRLDVKSGQSVKQGQLIGAAGNTGNSGGAHLHYELRFDNVKVDPLGAAVRPVIDQGATIAASTRGTNYLGEAYCFKRGISSTRLKPYVGNDAALREKFPGCTGWCKSY